MTFKKENINIYFVTGTIVFSLTFYLITLVMMQTGISNSSSLELYKERQAARGLPK